MPLHLIGLGLADERDITVRGLDIVRRAARVYLEAYTAILLVDITALEAFYGRPVLLADRELVESGADAILAGADTLDVALCVVGDPFGATTHTDLAARARARGIEVRVVHNASILNAVGCTGLQLYNFGQTVSMVFFAGGWRPMSWYDRVRENRGTGVHTLVLLDIKVREPDWEAVVRGRKGVYEAPKFMSVRECARQMIEAEEERGEGVCGMGCLVVGLARVGSERQSIRCGTLEEMAEEDMGEPLHSLILVGSRGHEMERDVLREYAINVETFDAAWERECGAQAK